jgi:hypothetical protein
MREPKRETNRERLLRRIAEQERWIEEHGQSLAGYIERYGDPDQSQCYGDGGTAIYAADTAALAALRRSLALRNYRRQSHDEQATDSVECHRGGDLMLAGALATKAQGVMSWLMR